VNFVYNSAPRDAEALPRQSLVIETWNNPTISRTTLSAIKYREGSTPLISLPYALHCIRKSFQDTDKGA
jgi:hypothetical protein